MKVRPADQEMINQLLGVAVTHSTKGEATFHNKTLPGMGGLFKLEVSFRAKNKVVAGAHPIYHFLVGEDLGIALEVVSHSYTRVYIGSSAVMRLRPKEELKLIAKATYEVMNGKIIHSHERPSGAH